MIIIKNKKAFSPVEEIIVLLVISVLIAAVYYRYNVLNLKAKTQAAKMDLYNIRLSVALFKIKHGKYPKNLYQLYQYGYIGSMLQKSRIDEKSITDPFGNRYRYDNKTGSVYLSGKTSALLYEK